MRHLAICLSLLAMFAEGCKSDHSPHSDYSAQIDALESADPAADVAAALAAGDLRFVGVMGDGPIVPGAPEWVRLKSTHRVRYIPNTSDAIESRQHAKLQQAAFEYAKRYNQVLLMKMPSLASTRP